MVKEFATGQPIYVVERDPDQKPCWVGQYTFIAQVENVAIARSDNTFTVWDLDSLLTRMLMETALEEDLGLVAFPMDDCYTTWETADRMRGVEFLRMEQESEEI